MQPDCPWVSPGCLRYQHDRGVVGPGTHGFVGDLLTEQVLKPRIARFNCNPVTALFFL